MPRRRMLTASAGALGLLWMPVPHAAAASADDGCPVPPGFPAGIEHYRQAYRNWAAELRVDDVWTAVAQRPGRGDLG